MSRYSVYIIPDTFKEIKNLPGNIRQRVRKAISELADNPRPITVNSLIFPILKKNYGDCDLIIGELYM